jgi:hypothetical protein
MNKGEESEELVNEYLKIATSYSMPLFWGEVSSGISSNGTAFVLDTGKRVFVVTAAHVYRSYLKQKEVGKVDFCQLSNISFELETRLISVPDSGSTDIATFEISVKELAAVGANVLRGSNESWPPKQPKEENMVVVSGFPGLERLKREQDYYSFGYYCFNTPVSTISSSHFGCSFDRKYWKDAIGKGLPPENYDMGGISGSPAIALIKSEHGIVTWRLAGVVYEATASEMLGEIMFVHHADLIESDGAVREKA